MILRDFVSLIFPEICVYCKEPRVSGEELLCSRCRLDLPKTDLSVNQETLLNKFASVPNIELATSYLKFTKKGMAQRLLHLLKYENYQEIGVMLGRFFGAELKSKMTSLSFDSIIPVPIHASRKRTRGYNQSDLISQGLSEILEIEWYSDVMVRNRKTATQTKKGKVERWQNVNEIFQVTRPEVVRNKKVLVVDDVITTGATLNAALETLAETGVSSMGVLCIATAD